MPEARFVLNVRDVGRWAASRLTMGAWAEWRGECPAGGFGPPWDDAARGLVRRILPFRERYRLCHGLADVDAVTAHWHADWARHVAAIQASISADRLLVFDVERDPPEALCRFAGLDTAAARHRGRENPALGSLGRAIARWTPRSAMRRIAEGLKRSACRTLRRR